MDTDNLLVITPSTSFQSGKSDVDIYDHMGDIELPEEMFDSFTPEEHSILESGGEIVLVIDSGKYLIVQMYEMPDF